MKNKHDYSLLVVDDEERARRHIIEDMSWEPLHVGPIYEASDGREAMAMLNTEHPDIMILDIRMPHLDGVGLLELLTQAHSEGDGGNHLAGWLRGCQPMVIALSGYSDFDAARKMLSSGIVVEYLLKPASEDQLFEAVYKCIERIDIKRGMQESMETVLEDGTDLPSRSPEQAVLPVNQSRQALIQEVKFFLAANYRRKLTLHMAADQVHINASYLSRLFTEVEGIGFSEYLCRLRMEAARELLQDYHLKIYEIADAVGYQDVKHFLKVFKKQTGMTPSEYREKSLMNVDFMM